MKKISAFFVSFVTVIMFMGIAASLRVSAATVLPTDSSSPRSGCTFLGIEGKYITQIQEALDRINEIRLEACKEGVKNPSTGSPLTIADYVPIQWSSDLEYIARLRAAEASVTMAHERTNGESIWGLKSPNGIRSYGEIIAWNRSETMTQGINQWYGEKYDWVNNTGGVTGHYTQMIDPDNHYVGLGAFCSNSAKYYNTTAGEFNRYLNDPDTSRGKPTGNIIQTLEVKNEHITYEISGSDTLSVSAAVTFTDYWSGTLKTSGLTVTGDSAENIRWSSSNNDVVTVSNGKLTVKKCGSAVITAKLPDGSSLTKNVSYQHSYKTTTTAATCASDGKTVKTCSVCGDTNTQVIPKTNQHSYKTATTAATCASDGKTVKTCTVCGDINTQVIPKTNQHSFGNWETTKIPTENSDGLEKRICTVCSTEETRTLRYEAPDTSSDVNSSSDDNSSANSSDNSSSTTSSSDNSSTTSSDDNSSANSSDDDSSATSSDDNSSANSPDDNSSANSSDDNSSANSSNDNSSANSPDDNSSANSSDDNSSAPSSSDNSYNSSSDNETQGEDISGNSGAADVSGASDNSPSNRALTSGMWMFAIIGGVLLAGVIVLVIYLNRRK